MRDYSIKSAIEGCREWLLTDCTGGYALGSCDGKLRRRYHGIYVAPLCAPLGRVMLVGFLEEYLICQQKTYALFDAHDVRLHFTLLPPDADGQESIEWQQNIQICGVALTCYKRVKLLRGGGCRVDYGFSQPLPTECEFQIRPALMERSHHGPLKPYALHHSELPFPEKNQEDGWCLRPLCPDIEKIIFQFDQDFVTIKEVPWKCIIHYETEMERGFESEEHVASRFLFSVRFPLGATGISLSIRAETHTSKVRLAEYRPLCFSEKLGSQLSVEKVDSKEEGQNYRQQLLDFAAKLEKAGRHFVVQSADHYLILAGYPWFGLWARDTFISLPGLCLVTGEFLKARSVFDFYLKFLNKGLIPNHIYLNKDKKTFDALYNHADGTLWMLYAAARYYQLSGDKVFAMQILDVVEEVVDWHEKGTHYNIHLDESDFLLYAGCYGEALTWMHAKIHDQPVTQRAGKPIEINALWITVLRKWAQIARRFMRTPLVDKWLRLAERANHSFAKYWGGPEYNWFADVIDVPAMHGYWKDFSLRPNQVIALMFPEVEIPEWQRRKALEAVRHALLTEAGLRSLSPYDSRYRSTYIGSPEARDAAYHNGIVWPWLLGPYVTALDLAWGKDSRAEREQVLLHLKPFLGRDCLGHIAEIYDAHVPYSARGAPAFALSVAEPLRALKENVL